MIYFTSDTHYGHSNIIKHCNRPFSSAEEMNEHMIKQWNSVVTPQDTVYHLGDFAFANKDKTKLIMSRLSGNKVLILGNHDDKANHKDAGWNHISTYYELKHDGQTYCMFHYPIHSWNKRGHGAIHLHGHVHASLMPDCRRFDVGVDSWNFTPVSIDVINKLAEKFPSEHDRHYVETKKFLGKDYIDA